MPQPGAKLTDDEQYQVCRWYGEFKSATQIRSLIKAEFGKELSTKNVWAYAHGSTMKKWKPLIERLRQEWALGVMDIPLAHKRARLEKLVLLLGRAERNMDVTEYQKIKQCTEVLREMREEMEAGKAEFTNVYMTTIHTYSDEEILRQRDAVLTRLKQLGRFNGTRHDREITVEPGEGTTTEVPASDAGRSDSGLDYEEGAQTLTGGNGSGRGLDGGQLGEGHGASSEAPTDSQGTGVQILEADDASQNGSPETVLRVGASEEALRQEDQDGHVGGEAAPLRHEGQQVDVSV